MFMQILKREELKAAVDAAKNHALETGESPEIKAPEGSRYTDIQYLDCCMRTSTAFFYEAWKNNMEELVPLASAFSKDAAVANIVESFFKDEFKPRDIKVSPNVEMHEALIGTEVDEVLRETGKALAHNLLAFIMIARENPSFLDDDELEFFLPHIIEILETKDPVSLKELGNSHEENLIRFCCYMAHTLYDPIISLHAAIEQKYKDEFGEPLDQEAFEDIRNTIRAFLIKVASSGYEHSHEYIHSAIRNDETISFSNSEDGALKLSIELPEEMPERQADHGVCPALAGNASNTVTGSVYFLTVDMYLDAIEDTYEPVEAFRDSTVDLTVV